MDANDEDGPGSSSGCALQMRPGGLGDHRAHVDVAIKISEGAVLGAFDMHVHLS